MPDSTYRVARRVARELASELLLTPPFDVDAVAERFADLLDDAIPGRTDVVTLHASVPGDHPRIVVQQALAAAPARRRFAIAHALGSTLRAGTGRRRRWCALVDSNGIGEPAAKARP